MLPDPQAHVVGAFLFRNTEEAAENRVFYQTIMMKVSHYLSGIMTGNINPTAFKILCFVIAQRDINFPHYTHTKTFP